MSSTATRSAVLGRRTCAGMAAAAATLHATMVVHPAHLLARALLVAMAAVCLSCAVKLWREGGVRTWTAVCVMNLAMIALHWSMPAHHHGATAQQLPPTEPMPVIMALATTASLAEAAIAAAVVYALTRRRAHALHLMTEATIAGPSRQSITTEFDTPPTPKRLDEGNAGRKLGARGLSAI